MRHGACVLAGLLAASCAQTGGEPVISTLTGERSAAPPPARTAEEDAGFSITGVDFAAELVFEESGGRVTARLDLAGAGHAPVSAELDIDRAWLSDEVQRYAGFVENGAEAVVELESGPCRTGARLDARFASIRVGEKTWRGCARETGPVVSWSESLPDHLDMIDACIERARSSSMAFVAGAARPQVIHTGAGAARFQLNGGGRWDCSVRNGRAEWRVVNDGEPPRPGEGERVFIPGAMPADGDGCYLYERVRAADGRLIGALGHDVCAAGYAAAQFD